ETQAPVAAAASSGPGRRVAVPVLYGRAAELHLLEELLAALSAGAGGGLIVRAAAGMGKSSLLRYLLDIAEQRGVLAFGSRSYEAENKLPSQSLAEMSAQMAAGADAPGGLEESFHLADFISRFATQRPIVLGFDDLYLADEVTLQLVHRLFRLAQRHAILLVATFRPWEGSQSRAFLQLLTSLRREGFMRELTLGPLDAATTRLVAGQQFEPEAVDAELLDDIAGEAGGNPFFAAELARSAIASGRASRAGGTWRLTSPTPIPVPRTVRDVFDRALERLAPLAADMLRVVAVAGADFDMALLSSILQAPEEQLVEALEQLMAAGLMAETQGAYVLGHSLLRRIVFERLTPPRRQLLLRRVAEAVAQRGAAEGQEKV
ncbi:MAG TPA: AAA family ATPase, partial [Chloroflexota bacterium]|nr:AAA family ATPase [Chloroflexota bacterium]